MYQMMIGTYTKRGSEGIYLLEMDDILQQVRVISVIGEKNPSYLCLDSEKKCLYAALENEVGEVAVYNVENRKAPKFMGKYETGGSTTCHVSLSVDHKWLYASNYEDGSFTIFEVGDALRKSRIIFNQAGRYKAKPHAHSVFSILKNEAICCDKGLDSVLIYGDGGEICRFYLKGSNFRILESEKQNLYLVAEKSSEIVVISYEHGKLTLQQRISTVEKGFAKINYAAAVRISPDRQYLYTTNRGEDTIVIYKIQKDGTLEFLERHYLPGQFPRDFNISKDGKILGVALEYSDCVVFYDVDNNTGTIRLRKERMMWNYLSRITERGVLMIKNRRIGHIGIATNDVARDVEWYVNVLGFEVTGKFQNGNDTVYFLKNDDVIFEIFPSDSRLPNEVSGRIDHYSFASDDIESDYAYCVKNGYKIVTDGIEGIAGFWDNGIRYFKIASPTGEQFEFCQIL